MFKNFKNLKVRMKLLVSHGMIAIIGLVVICICIFGMKFIEGQVEGMYTGPMHHADVMTDVMYDMSDMRRLALRAIAEREHQDYAEFEEEFNHAAEEFTSILEGTEEVAEVIALIEETAKEQAQAISQITIAVDQISKVVQNAAATSEESAAGSEELSGQANMLQDMVAKFELS